MLVKQKRKLDFCTDAVCAADEHGLLHSLEVGSEKSAEAAYSRYYARNICARNVLFHKLYTFVACGNVNACRLVTL